MASLQTKLDGISDKMRQALADQKYDLIFASLRDLQEKQSSLLESACLLKARSCQGRRLTT